MKYFPLSSETKDRFWMFRRNAAYLLMPSERKHDIRFIANFSFYLLLKATRKQEAIWRSRLYPRTRCLHLVNIWLQPWLRVQKIEASACSSPAECLELPAGEWRSERDGGAWPGGQLEEEAEVDQEGEGGDQQWHHHQDLAETLRRWWPMLIFDNAEIDKVEKLASRLQNIGWVWSCSSLLPSASPSSTFSNRPMLRCDNILGTNIYVLGLFFCVQWYNVPDKLCGKQRLLQNIFGADPFNSSANLSSCVAYILNCTVLAAR